MKKLSRIFVIAVSTAFMLLLIMGCAGKISLMTQDVQGSDNITGLYTLILYRSGASLGDLKTVAFLAAEEDGYSWEPYAPVYECTVTPHVSGQKAFQIALKFIRSNSLYENYQIRRILDQTGKTIGYEVRPLYDSAAFGLSDIMTISYLLTEGGIIQIYIDLLETVRKQIIGEY